jgi:two-component system CheB/CheR fusion protein
LLEIFTLLRIRTKHDFTNYKRATVLRRLERRINVHQLDGLHSYAKLLRENKEETRLLLRNLLISVTNFFGDSEAFKSLEQKVIPKIFENKSGSDNLRVWVVGCATGEEAYSLAMVLTEFTDKITDPPKLQIFATDIDEDAINKAREGLYSNSDIADVPPERLKRFFVKGQAGYRICREVREIVLFALHNVIKDPPFSRLDLITCRNLLIYMNFMAQQRLIESFHFALNPGGHLFLGMSESGTETSSLYTAVDESSNIYQSRPVKTNLPLPVSELPYVLRSVGNDKLEKPQESTALERLSYIDIHQRLLEQYAPPSVVINEGYDIIHFSDRAGIFMQIAGGEPSYNLLKVVHPEFRIKLRTALYQAIQQMENVETGPISTKINGQTKSIKIIVCPVMQPSDATRGLILVVFEETIKPKKNKVSEIAEKNEPVVQRLEDELIHVKTQLRSTIEQYEVQTKELKASNEELQSINEKLHSTAEELETSKEELQSVNEELMTVNQELKITIEDLSQSNNDFQNLINSTDIGTLFLDRSLRVKFYTPPSLNIFNLIPTDIDRPLSDISSKIKNVDFQADVQKVLSKLQPVEQEFETVGGKWYLMKIQPYIISEDLIEGVIITFVEITDRKLHEQELKEMTSEIGKQARIFETTLSTVTDFTYILDREGRFVYSNQALLDFFGLKPEEIMGKNFLELPYPEDLAFLLQKQVQQVFKNKKIIKNEIHLTNSAGVSGFYTYILNPVINDDGTVDLVAGSAWDITERRENEERLRQSESRLRFLIESATDYAIFTIKNDLTIDSWNLGAERIFGYKENEIIGKGFEILFTSEDRRNKLHEKEIAIAIEKGRANDERWHVRKDRSRFFASGVVTLIDNDETRGFVKIARDETEKMRTKAVLQDKKMLRRLVVAQEDERRRIARDLHDQLGQQLTALRFDLDFLKKMCGENKTLREKINKVQKVAENIDIEIDSLVWELRPSTLDDLGLRTTLANYVKEWTGRSEILTDFHSSGLSRVRLPREIETNIYRITQEALNNVQKHAKAKNVSVILEKRKDKIVLIVEDDGIGFDTEKVKKQSEGLGLLGMCERAEICGGIMEVESAKSIGTSIFIRVPIKIENRIDTKK